MKKVSYQIAALVVCIGFVCSSALANEWDDITVPFFKKDAVVTPSAANHKGYFNWTQCWDEKFDEQPIGPDNVVGLPAPCRPDTLFSWGSPHKLNDLMNEAGDGKPWADHFSTDIFTHINPLATFGYGTHAFRFKLKASTKFLLLTQDDDNVDNNGLCRQYLSLEAQKNTVIVRAWALGSLTGVDYILCSPKVLHSWSTDTKIHFDEIAASLQWNMQNVTDDNANNWIPYVYSSGTAALFDSGVDSLDWSSDKLMSNMKDMHRFAAAGSGKIVYASDVAKTQADHFSTTHQIYWNYNH